MKNQNKEQEIAIKMHMLEQQAGNIQQQIQAVEQAKNDLKELNSGIKNLKGAVGKEILAQIGRGIFVKAKLLSEELIVDIGNKNLVSKKIEETTKLIDEQLEKLGLAEKELENNMQDISQKAEKILSEIKEFHDEETCQNFKHEK